MNTRVSAEIALGVVALSLGLVATWAAVPETFPPLRQHLQAMGLISGPATVISEPGDFDLLLINTLSKNLNQEAPEEVLERIQTLTGQRLKML